MRGEADYEYHHFSVKALDSMGFLTYRCTSMCRTCNIWKRNAEERDELSRDQWLSVLTKLKRYGIRSFEIFGGDALLRKDVVFDVVRYCSERGIKTYFPTNGNLCDRETVRSLVDAGLGTIYLSIDDIGEDHDGIRGVDGTFQKVKKALETFIEVRGGAQYPKIIICNTLSDMNFRNFSNIMDFLEQYPIDAVYPRMVGEFSESNVHLSSINGAVPEPYFASSDNASHLLNSVELGEFKSIIREEKKRRRNIYINYRVIDIAKDKTFLAGEYDYKHCHIATTFVTVNPNGDIVPCPFFRSYVIGNLLEQELEEIWGNALHRKFLSLQKKQKIAICKNCNMRAYYPSMLESIQYYFKRFRELTS
ncbi:MAG: radical SAM protein [Nitrospira bacterium SG8_35_4]|nr:MAG: radical SAM protein [Nitrospira bacterium SG8_35_4]